MGASGERQPACGRTDGVERGVRPIAAPRPPSAVTPLTRGEGNDSGDEVSTHQVDGAAGCTFDAVTIFESSEKAARNRHEARRACDTTKARTIGKRCFGETTRTGIMVERCSGPRATGNEEPSSTKLLGRDRLANGAARAASKRGLRKHAHGTRRRLAAGTKRYGCKHRHGATLARRYGIVMAGGSNHG